MSTFLSIARFEDGDDAGERLPITRQHLVSAATRQPRFRILEQDGAVGVKVLSNAVAVLEEGGTLSCQLDGDQDVDLLTDTLKELASLIPDAVVRDEEGNTY